MPFTEEESTGAQLLQHKRCESFATQAAERIRAAENCLFSLLPYEELSRLAANWYEAYAQGMLRGNYAPVDKWVRSQSYLAATQGFAPEDLSQLLLICRSSAIEVEGWNEDILSTVDEVIQEVFGSIRPNLPWNIGDGLDYLVDPPSEAEANTPSAGAEEWTSERRRFPRNRLCMPIRVRGVGKQRVEEVTRTQSVSRGGLYFVTCEEYQKDQFLKIDFPYWNQPGDIKREYAAKVVRVDRLPDKTLGVGVDFQESLGRLPNRTQRKI